MTAPSSLASAAAYDVSVYKDQLTELDRDIERGLITADEAARARTEISRRLIAASERAESAKTDGVAAPFLARRTLALIIGVFLITAPIVIYTTMGAPGLPSQPFAARQAERLAEQQQMKQVRQQLDALEARLKQNPGELEGWYLLGRAYMQLGEFNKAVAAFDAAMAANGISARLLTNKAIALISADEGRVTAQAENALRQALEFEPQSGIAQYFIGLALAQRQDLNAALALWREAIGNAPLDAPWREQAVQNIARAERELALPPLAPLKGPTSDDVAAAQGMTDQDRGAMIAGMVARLNARLRENPNDLDGWLQLVRSYGVLGDGAAAREALAKARAAFAGDASALARLSQAEKSLTP